MGLDTFWRWVGVREEDREPDEDQLIQQLMEDKAYLQQELTVARAHTGQRIRLTAEERSRLLRFAEPLGDRVYDLVKVVRPETFRRWRQNAGQLPPPRKRMGRPRIKKLIVFWILQMARENADWTHRRIQKELNKMGISIAPNTVYNYMEENDIEPPRSRRKLPWLEYLGRLAKTAWAADFFTVRTLTGKGFVYFYALVFIHLESRRMWISGITPNPHEEWVTDQGKRFIERMEDSGEMITHLILDQDSKYAKGFKKLFKQKKIKLQFISRGAPKMNAYAEVVIRIIKHECLRHFVALGEKHLWYLLKNYERYYNEHRPHGSIGMTPESFNQGEGKVMPIINPHGQMVKSESFLGGLHHSYSITEFKQAA